MHWFMLCRGNECHWLPMANGWVNLVDGAIYGGSDTITLLVTHTTTDDGNQYRVLVSNSSFVCTTIISVEVILTVKHVRSLRTSG